MMSNKKGELSHMLDMDRKIWLIVAIETLEYMTLVRKVLFTYRFYDKLIWRS